MSKLFPSISGGPYTYSKAEFGDFIGFLVAWGYLIQYFTDSFCYYLGYHFMS